jgi:predicted nuclease of predicted toxin-antitoxin system
MRREPGTLRLLADMGVSRRVVDWLRSQGHDAIHLREQDLQRLPDGEVFAKAARERRTVLTFDLDFGEIAAFCRERPVSVVVFRLRDARTSHVIERLRAVLATAREALEAGAVIAVEESRHRIRRLPIGVSPEQAPASRPRRRARRR